MRDISRETVISHLSAYANGQFDLDTAEPIAIVNRRQFDFIPAPEEANDDVSAEALPYLKRWRLERGTCRVLTDEQPVG